MRLIKVSMGHCIVLKIKQVSLCLAGLDLTCGFLLIQPLVSE